MGRSVQVLRNAFTQARDVTYLTHSIRTPNAALSSGAGAAAATKALLSSVKVHSVKFRPLEDVLCAGKHVLYMGTLWNAIDRRWCRFSHENFMQLYCFCALRMLFLIVVCHMFIQKWLSRTGRSLARHQHVHCARGRGAQLRFLREQPFFESAAAQGDRGADAAHQAQPRHHRPRYVPRRTIAHSSLFSHYLIIYVDEYLFVFCTCAECRFLVCWCGGEGQRGAAG